MSKVGESTGGKNCRGCNEPDEADSQMVQCDGCSHWYHFRCAGVGNSIADESRTYICAFCAASPAQSDAPSTTASAREAKLRLEMQRLEEEKELRARLLAEKEKQEKDMQEMAMRMEKERREKAIADLMVMEKEFLEKKYRLLQASLEDDEEAKSIRSHRSVRQGVSRVQEWMNAQPAKTLSSNPGGKAPTGLTSMATNDADPPSALMFNPGSQPATTAGEISLVTNYKGLISPVITIQSYQREEITMPSRSVPPAPLEVQLSLICGSDSTLVESSIVEQLGIVGKPTPLCLQWTSGVKRIEEQSQCVELSISGSGLKKRFTLNDVHTVKSLDLPRQSLSFNDLQKDFSHLRGLPVKSYYDASPGILIGLDNTNVKTTLKLREGKTDGPVAAKTRIGWVVFGRNRESREEVGSHRVLHVCSGHSDHGLHDLVKDFFRVEGTGVSTPNALVSTEDRRAKEILEATTFRTASGRFQTGLLWKYDQVEFPDSRPMAERRLHCLEKRLQKSPELYSNVKQQIAAYQQKGYAHIATDKELTETDPKRVWYLPLGVVINAKKPEKVRVVWDAASAVKGVSLNSVLLKGPDLLTSLTAVLSRYRQKQVAISADIREMFHQVEIRSEDRQAQRFLWRDSPSQPMQVFVMDVATFGSTCSPCSLQFVKNVNADDHANEFPKAAEAVKKNHYVDDYLDSADTVDEAVQLANEVRAVHKKGGFEIRHWLSNSKEVIQRIGERSEATSKQFVIDKCSETERVLGITWLPKEDVFSFSVQLRDSLHRLVIEDVVPTKREALSLVMSVFDPLGLVAVILVHGKVLLQDIWRTGVDWDEPIHPETFIRWKAWTQMLLRLNDLNISRCYFPGYEFGTYNSLELHTFVDASEVAYAACSYFRVVDGTIVRCCLVSARTKVAPLKPLSVPRNFKRPFWELV
ncbi:uncharacterized protein LOC134222129 [Armigeres subalbatus]|uniref:uncharacterized protein LOC134222129 n=1 Tax=Armigeres subalbatus TaxID=124917 RepID=UPI002ED4492E